MFHGLKERIVSIWIGPMPFTLIYGAEECEAILGGQKTLTKLFHYKYLSPWIGDGLLIRSLPSPHSIIRPNNDV